MKIINGPTLDFEKIAAGASGVAKIPFIRPYS